VIADMTTTILAFRCGSCLTALAVPPGNHGAAARCGCCRKAIRVPHSAIEVVDDAPEEPVASSPSGPAEPGDP